MFNAGRQMQKGKQPSFNATSLKRSRNSIISQHEAFINVHSSVCPSLLYVVWGVHRNEKPEGLPQCKTANDEES